MKCVRLPSDECSVKRPDNAHVSSPSSSLPFSSGSGDCVSRGPGHPADEPDGTHPAGHGGNVTGTTGPRSKQRRVDERHVTMAVGRKGLKRVCVFGLLLSALSESHPKTAGQRTRQGHTGSLSSQVQRQEDEEVRVLFLYLSFHRVRSSDAH